jgi:hypothetical protein
MDKIYLLFNAALYVFFALLCTLRYGGTTRAQGFLELDNNGRCEYLAVYGGMEMGFAVFYVLCAMKAEWRGAGILFSLCMYAGIVAWRLTSFAFLTGISTMTKSIAGLEVVLLIFAAVLFFQARVA